MDMTRVDELLDFAQTELEALALKFDLREEPAAELSIERWRWDEPSGPGVMRAVFGETS